MSPGVLLFAILGGGVLPGSPSPDPAVQSKAFHTRFQTTWRLKLMEFEEVYSAGRQNLYPFHDETTQTTNLRPHIPLWEGGGGGGGGSYTRQISARVKHR